MGNLSGFMNTFSSALNNAPLDDEVPAHSAQPGGALAAFVNTFGPTYESLWFYNNTIEVRFDKVEHEYFLVEELGNLTLLPNVSSVSKIVDRSVALIPWTAKVTIEKLLRIIPTETVMLGPPGEQMPVIMIPSMTLEQFTKVALDAKTAHSDKLEDAGNVGHIAHEWLEQYIKAILANDTASQQGYLNIMTKDPRANSCVIAALDWMKSHNVRWIATERKCYSKKHKCGGTMDGKALVDSCSDPTCCPVPFKDRLSLIDWKSSNYLYIDFLFQTAAYEAFDEEEFPDVQIEDRWILRLGKDDGIFDPWHLTAEDFKEDFEGYLACLHLYRIFHSIEERMKAQKGTIKAAKKAAREAAKELAKAQEKAEKAAKKAEAKLLKAEEKARIKEEAKAAREAAKAEAKAEKLAGKTNAKLVPTDAEVKDLLSGPFTVETLVLSPADAKAFVAALDNPPAPVEAAVEAARKYVAEHPQIEYRATEESQTNKITWNIPTGG